MRRRRGARANRGLVELAETIEALRLSVPPEVTTPPVPYRYWERAVGTRIASRARPYRLERGVLHVRVTSSVWSSELQLLSPEILGQLREAGCEVESLRFSVGRVDGLGPPPPPEREAPRPEPLPTELASQVSRIQDEGLREAVARAASHALGAETQRRRRPR